MIHIAIIDDHPASRVFLDRFLQAEGFHASVFECAEEAVEAFGRGPIDVWLVDWMLPGLSGLELVRTIRARADGATPYFIMLTSKDSEEDLATAFEAGVDDFIAKPIGGLELRARLKAAVRLVNLTRDLKQRVIEVEHLNQRLLGVNEELEVIASTDAMTGLLNRRAGLTRLEEAWSGASRHKRPLSVAVVDIDNFKAVNDMFGHARGDAAIRFVATALRDAIRQEDIIARIGGEEFLIVFPDTQAAAASESLRRAGIRVHDSKCMADGRELSLTFSAGVAERSASTATAEELIKTADAALYRAKNAGRNRVACDGAGVPSGIAA